MIIMKKLITYAFYALLLAVFAVNVDLISSQSDKQNSTTIEYISELISTSEAVATDNGVDCNCAFWGGNGDCRADNGGRRCAPVGTANCRTLDANCG
jgi:hypothetical protein